jgi:hypothetical protein
MAQRAPPLLSLVVRPQTGETAMLDWLWAFLAVTALYVPVWLVLDVIARFVFGNEQVAGQHHSVAHTVDAQPIVMRAILHLPIGIVLAQILAANISRNESLAKFGAIVGCLSFMVVETGFRAMWAYRYWESGHLQAREKYVKTIGAVLSLAVVGVIMSIANVFIGFLSIPPLAEYLAAIADSGWRIPLLVFGGITTLVAFGMANQEISRR